MNITLVVALVLLLGATGVSRKRYPGVVYWNAWCDNRAFGTCVDWDYSVIIVRPVIFTYTTPANEERVESIINLPFDSANYLNGYHYDVGNTGSWQTTLDAVLDGSDSDIGTKANWWDNWFKTKLQATDVIIDIPPIDRLDFTTQKNGWDVALEHDMELYKIKDVIKNLVSVYLCNKYRICNV